MVFNQYVGAIALFRVAVVDQGIVECIDMAGCFPDCRVHEYSGVDTHNIVVQEGHSVPPVALDIVFEFYAVLAVVVDGRQTVVYFT